MIKANTCNVLKQLNKQFTNDWHVDKLEHFDKDETI